MDTDRAAASIEIQEQDASPEDLDRLAEGLSRELSDLDVDRVTKATAGRRRQVRGRSRSSRSER